MQALHFLGGPWDNRTVESEVVHAPSRVKPDPEAPGTYFRAEHDIGTGTVTYVWRADETDAD